MLQKNNNDAQDTMQFRVPKQPQRDIEQTRIYKRSDIAAQSRIQQNSEDPQNSSQQSRPAQSRPSQSRTGSYQSYSGNSQSSSQQNHSKASQSRTSAPQNEHLPNYASSTQNIPVQPQKATASSQSKSRQRTAETQNGRVQPRTEKAERSHAGNQPRSKTSASKNPETRSRATGRNYEISKKAAKAAQQNNEPKQTKRRKKHAHIWIPKFIRKFFGRIFILIIAVFMLYSAAALNYITKTSSIENTGRYVNDQSKLLYSSEIKNILVIGADARDDSVRGLSDSIILISLNKKNKKIQMTSFMRDMYTEIEGYDHDKLNAAYSYGGAELLKDTIEDNFRVRIDGCVTVNFTAVAHIVDAVGGVRITLSEDEAHAVNDILYSEVNEIMGDKPDSDFLKGAGTYMLNGKQALSYSRIRYIGDADFERTQRQRTVITQILERMKKINPIKFDKNIKKALEYIGTDMSVPDMYMLSLRLPVLLAGYETEQLRVPADGTWWYDETWDGQSIIGVNFSENTKFIREKIYLK